ncbi:hypothetical protein NIES4071_45360 [Calothrix sp. NIES-4071]|nr:hypothetical protein NIES4071_45360 [Calothrix sp. NIES-4071]BAZ58849.1 hypothetical protein NIES4105_45290 [Calothrix sp. NIES-4105]
MYSQGRNFDTGLYFELFLQEILAPYNLRRKQTLHRKQRARKERHEKYCNQAVAPNLRDDLFLGIL